MSKNKNYTHGYTLEAELVRSCKKQGFVYAQRTAGSHSVADVIAVAPNGIVIFFQCKYQSGQLKGLTTYLRDDNVHKLLALPDTIIKCLVIREEYKGIPIIHTFKYTGEVVDNLMFGWERINFVVKQYKRKAKNKRKKGI